ncbi:MAG: T9SS type A sorting domain-containing protein [Bacteroidia bacterium]
MKKLVLACILAIAGSINTIYGQSSLGIYDSTSVVPTNMYFNGSYPYHITLKNYSSFSFSGQLQLAFAVDTIGNGTLTQIGSMTPTLTLAAGDTTSLDTTITTDSTKFKSGINTVVIWPRNITTTFVTHDSLKVQVLILGYSGIENFTDHKPILFPNPVQSRLFIQKRGQKLAFERVSILNFFGQVIHTEPFNGWIDVGNLSPGVYTMEFAEESGKLYRCKIIKE